VAEENGIDNSLPEALRTNAERVCLLILEPLRAVRGLPLRVNSWYRCETLNTLIPGSAADSAHLLAMAADIDRTTELWADIVTAGLLKSPFVRCVIEDSHYHLALIRPGESAGRVASSSSVKEWEVS
jgi:hypothetical protein